MTALLLSLLLLAGNAFFVAAEFALTASRAHRLTQQAEQGSRAARAALTGTRQLTLMLAGAQLGITLCSLGLGALAEPTIAHALEPVLHALGLPAAVSWGVAFVVALAVVTVVHIVVGEMAPKSWAISRPETAARALALPFLGFVRLLRPVLTALNAAANGALRLVGVTPVTHRETARGPAELRVLLRDSTDAGLIPADQHRLLDGLLALRTGTLAAVMVPAAAMDTVPAHVDGDGVVAAHRRTGRSRFPVTDGGRVLGVVHVRDAARAPAATAAALATPALRLPVGIDPHTALTTMQRDRRQLAVVTDGTALVGLVTLEDLVEQVIGEFADETDRQPAAATGV
jgi:CBS domain containing-hemolysin-like protein